MTRSTHSPRNASHNRLALIVLATLMVAVTALTGCPGDDDNDNDQLSNNLGRLFNNGNNGNNSGGDVLGGGGTGTGNGSGGGGSTTDPGSPSNPSTPGGPGVTTPGGGSDGASCSSACGMLDYCGILADLGATAGDCTVLCADENPDPADLAIISSASCDELRYAVFGESEPTTGGTTTECYEYQGDEYCDEYPTTPGEDPHGEGGETWDIDDVYAYCAEFPDECAAYCAEYPEDCEALGL